MPNTKNLSGEIIEVRIRPYLKDYFIVKYGGKEPIPATVQNKILPFLDSFLTHKPKNWKPPKSKEDNLLFHLPFSEFRNIRTLGYISPHNYGLINSYLYALFYSDFISFMTEKTLKDNWQIKYAIIHWMDLNKIPIDKIKDHFWSLHKI